MHKDILDLGIRPSRSLCTLILSVHALAAVGILLAEMATTLQLAFLYSLLCSLAWYLGQYGFLRHPASVRSIHIRHGKWLVLAGSGELQEVTLQSPVFVLWFLVVLNLVDIHGRRYQVPVFADAVDDTAFRHFRVFLLTGAFRSGNGLQGQPNMGGTRMVSSALSSRSG